jgi:hypothetical protein
MLTRALTHAACLECRCPLLSCRAALLIAAMPHNLVG